MNCMIPKAEVSRGKALQKVSGQITAQLQAMFGPGLWQRREIKRRRDKRGMNRE